MTIRDEAYAGQPISAFVIDAHTHLAPYYMSGWYQTPNETTNAAIVASMDRLGINCLVSAPHTLVTGMMARANELVAAAAEEFPDRIYGYLSVCPGEGLDALKAELKKYDHHPRFVGMKFLPGYHGELEQPEYQYAADYAAEKNAVVLTHTWSNSPDLAEVEELAAKRPDLHVLCAHQGGGAAHLSQRLAEIMQRVPNISMEICGSLINPLAIEDLVDLVGADRVVYGSDLINLDVRYDFGRVVFSPLTDADKRKILAENYLCLLEKSQMSRIQMKQAL
jgi:hypothetical protein